MQAALAEPYGLRDFLAVTTDWRPHWDGLPANPLFRHGAEHTLAVELAEAAMARAEREPWKSALSGALNATAQIAVALGASAPRGSLWRLAKSMHPSGFPLGQKGQLCGDCVWGSLDASSFSFACRQQRLSEHQPLAHGELSHENPACNRFERRFGSAECRGCGACCREGFHEVEVGADEPLALINSASLVRRGEVQVLPRPQGSCVYLSMKDAGYTCDEYALRPRSCADFPIAGDACLLARRRVGFSR